MKPPRIMRQLADERRAQKLTVEELADKTGYSTDHLMKLECGHRLPGFNTLTAWAQTLGFEIVLQRKNK